MYSGTTVFIHPYVLLKYEKPESVQVKAEMKIV